MSDVDTLLNNELNDGKTILKIDEPTRTIKYNSNLLLGVEKDYQAKRIYFEAPRIVGDGIDLTSDSVQIYINFENGYSESYIYECTDKVLQEDDTVLFSWLLTEKVTEVKGTVEFMVCVKNTVDGLIHNEWHTIPFDGYVEEGIDVSQKTPEIIVDNTASTAALIEEIKVLEYKVDNAVGFTKEEVNELLDTKADKEETNATANELYTYIQHKASAADVYTKIEVNELLDTKEAAVNQYTDMAVIQLANNCSWKDYGTWKIDAVRSGMEVYFAIDAGTSSDDLLYIAENTKNSEELILHISTLTAGVWISTSSSYNDTTENHEGYNAMLFLGSDNGVLYEATIRITKIGDYYYWTGTACGTTLSDQDNAISARTKYPYFVIEGPKAFVAYVTVCGRGANQ